MMVSGSTRNKFSVGFDAIVLTLYKYAVSGIE